MAIEYVGRDKTDGVVVGQSGGKVGVFGKAPTTQLAATTAPAATAATNSSPYGYSQAQADAIVTWIRAVDAHLKAMGIIAS